MDDQTDVDYDSSSGTWYNAQTGGTIDQDTALNMLAAGGTLYSTGTQTPVTNYTPSATPASTSATAGLLAGILGSSSKLVTSVANATSGAIFNAQGQLVALNGAPVASGIQSLLGSSVGGISLAGILVIGIIGFLILRK